MTHPKNKIPKDYEAIIEGRITLAQKQKIKKGIYIGFKEYGQAEVLEQSTQKTRSKVILRLRQGKKREIRRIFYKLNMKLIGLKRISFSQIKLGNLEEGSHRALNKRGNITVKRSMISNFISFFFIMNLC